MDPDTERFSVTERNVHGALSAYKQIHDEKKKQTNQTTMDTLLKRVTAHQEEPPVGPSGGVPEESIIIIGDERPMCSKLYNMSVFKLSVIMEESKG